MILLISLVLPLPCAYSQPWRDELSNYFEAIRSDQVAPVPSVALSDHGAVLGYLATYLGDSSSAVSARACEMIYRVGEKSMDPDIRTTSVGLLLRACARGNPGVTGIALNYLRTFERTSFSSAAKDDAKALLTGGFSHLQALIKLIGFLQFRDLVPELRQFAGPGNSPSVRWAALISLARLGDAGATRQMMARVRQLGINDDVVYNIFPDLVFSRSEEAISYMIDVIHSEANDCQSADAEREVMIPCGYRVMEQLAPVIKDFPLELDSSGDLKTSDYPAALQQVRQWFLENKHYVIINDTY